MATRPPERDNQSLCCREFEQLCEIPLRSALLCRSIKQSMRAKLPNDAIAVRDSIVHWHWVDVGDLTGRRAPRASVATSAYGTTRTTLEISGSMILIFLDGLRNFDAHTPSSSSSLALAPPTLNSSRLSLSHYAKHDRLMWLMGGSGILMTPLYILDDTGGHGGRGRACTNIDRKSTTPTSHNPRNKNKLTTM